ncbi:MAG: sigma-70 family RNA polymerase sigma factor [Candidatus Poribacteria bacterium]|nr:sigma-70 family RNA polymerase sigma factor [Candidatus Poribacteria bacterium]
MKNNDADLIQQTLDGDQHAFTTLVKKYQKQVHALAWQKIGDFHIAQEIAQDTFLTAYQKLATLTHHNRFVGWLYVITNNKCKNWHRKKRLALQSLEETNPVELEEVYYSEYMIQQREEAANQKRRAVVQKLLSKLQESDRTIVNLYYIAEMTCEEIGKFLGVSPNTVRSRLHRARNRLKKEETMIKDNLSSFQLPTQMTENIMKEISRLNPIAPSGNKPLVPLAVSAAAAILVLLIMGSGTQYLNRFQKPYSLNAQSEPTIEIIDTQLVIDTPAKPAVRTQVGKSDGTGRPEGVGQKPDAPLLAAAHADETEISKPIRQWSDVKGPEGGTVGALFTTNRGDVYATSQNGLYRLTDDGQSWKLINTIKYSVRDALTGRNVFRYMAEWQNTLYRAVDKEILASTDGGVTWKVFCECIKGELVGMVITDQIPGGQSDMTIYLAYEKGVFRSDNAGKSWTPLPEGIKDRTIRAFTAVGNTVFAGTYKGLYRLNGEIWEQLFYDQTNRRSNTYPILTLAASGNNLYVARPNSNLHQYQLRFGIISRMRFDSRLARRAQETAFGGWSLFCSTDQGDSWDPITPTQDNIEKKAISMGKLLNTFTRREKDNKLPYNHRIRIFISIAASGKQVLVVSDKEHFYSTNTGKTWKTLGNTNNMGSVFASVLLNENTFYRSGKFGIYRTTDSGKTWHQFNTGFVNTHIKELIAVNGVLYAHTPSGLLSSTDGGESWTPVPGDTGYFTRMTESNGELYVRDDKIGTPRFYRLSTKDNRLIDVSKVPAFFNVYDPNKAMEELREMNTTHSRPLTMMGSFYTSMLGSFAVNEGTYYVEYIHKLFKWKPGLSEWMDTGIFDEGDSLDHSFFTLNWSETIGFKLAVSGNTVYVGKQDDHLMQSVDGGNTWNDVTTNLPFSVDGFRAIVFAGNFVYVATDKGVVLSGNGTDWHTITTAKGKPLVMNRLAVDDTTVYGESNQKIYQFKRDIGTWQQVTPKISHHVTCLAVDDNTLYVGTDRQGVLRFSLK